MVDTIRGKFAELFGQGAQTYMSSGRINLIGEHTDYNYGFVVPAAINYGIYAAVKANGGQLSRIYFNDLDLFFEVDLYGQKPDNQSALYVYGVVQGMRDKGFDVPAFDMVIGGDVPNGAGLSSSAALTSCVGYAINDMYSLGIEPEDIAHIGQLTEHNYIGVKCGIMDQFASIFGRKGNILRLDCRSLKFKYEPFELESKGLSLLLLDTKVKHNLASSEYNIRREQCQNGVDIVAKYFYGVTSLRDVTVEMLTQCRSAMDSSTYLRCLYVVEENQRVENACAALEQGDFESFGLMMNLSHHGLSKMYNVSCRELDVLADFAHSFEGVLGARMMGGGFGGCTINLVKTSVKNDFVEQVSYKYKSEFGILPRVVDVKIDDGAHKII